MQIAQQQFNRYAIPACPTELTAPILHQTLNHPTIQPHIYGGKGIGSQGDGSVQFLARSSSDQQTVAHLLQTELGMTPLLITIKP